MASKVKEVGKELLTLLHFLLFSVTFFSDHARKFVKENMPISSQGNNKTEKKQKMPAELINLNGYTKIKGSKYPFLWVFS